MKQSYLTSLLVLTLIMCSISCSKEEKEENRSVTISHSSIQMNYDERFQLTATNATTWKSNNDFVASVDDNGVVEAAHVGNSIITAANELSSAVCKVSITPRYALYDTPILTWNVSMFSVHQLETHEGAPSNSSGENVLGYNYTKNSEEPCLVAYSFEFDRLVGVTVILKITSYVDASYYLLERYQPIYVNDTQKEVMYADAYDKKNWKTIVYQSIDKISGTNVTSITYMPASVLPSIGTRSYASNKCFINSTIKDNIDMFQ